MKLSTVAATLQSKLIGEDAEFEGVSTDTRTLTRGALFIALQGPNFDGNDFVEEACKRGAAGAIVTRAMPLNLPLIPAKDTKLALAQLAHFHRQQFKIPVVAVTGSCGKTTTRALVESIFRQCGPVLASLKSFNNEIGVPLTLLRLRHEHAYAVLELGANHPGEIAVLTQLVEPTVAVITNAGPVHLEGFGSIEGVAKAKGEIFQGLPESGCAIINADDPFASLWRNKVTSRVITFAINSPADVEAKDITVNTAGHVAFRLVLLNEQVEVQLNLVGVHNVSNALAAAAAAYAEHVPLKAIKAGLEAALPVSGRLNMQKGFQGALIIDDSYNANPLSVSAAIASLARLAGDRGYSILVLGDMLELGEGGDRLHREIGERALQLGITQLFGYGPLTKNTVEAFGEQGHHFGDQKQLILALKEVLSADSVVLIKGSFSMRMGEVVGALLESGI